MKKNDGYVIIYVVFVVLFLCIVAVGTCTSALNNLKTQHAVVEQMQERYTAEGNIEQFMAEVCIAGEAIGSTGQGLNSNEYMYDTADAAAASAKADFVTVVANGDGVECTNVAGWSPSGNEYIVTLESVAGSTKISATVAFHVSIATGIAHTDDDGKAYFSYNISSVTSKYISYSLESTGGDAE